MIQAATGIGKTYLSAFDDRGRQKILFIAHREEILDQARIAFHNVHPEKTCGFLRGNEKKIDADIVFASVMTLCQNEWLEKLPADCFDYIVIDEFHHAVTDSYRKIIDHFQPDFLLGLTATPERMDGRDVFALCDYNIPYSITLQDAINKGVLCPFHYYGIYDSTDYSSIPWQNSKYSTTELDRLYRGAKERTQLILSHFRKHHPRRALAFCSSKAHAQMMKEEFKKAGISSAAVYSGSEDDRSQSLKALKNGELQVIFSVDMFNEGVDIPDVDAVLMLRPTQSPTIFLQQLGRGLRKAPGKAYLTVLDFIGNYRNANRIPAFLEGSTASCASPMHISAPVDCLIDFDLRLLDLFEEMERNASRIRFEPHFLEEYSRIEKLKHHRPTRMDLFEELDEPVLQAASRRGSKNPLHSYLKFLHDHDLLDSQEEQSLWNSPARALIELLESTRMSQLYKIPVLSAFLENDRIQTSLTKEQLLKSWKEFFACDENWKDFVGMKGRGKIRSYQDFLAVSDQKHLSNILSNPIHFLIQSSNGLFVQGEGDQVIRLNLDLSDIDAALLAREWKDILEFRTIEYRRNRFEYFSK